MGKYESLAKDIIKNVGGKENIISVTHCVTRLRFNLADESKANDDVLKNMKGVVTVMKTAGQYQVVIGNHVPDVYKDVLEVAGIGENSNKGEAKKMPLKDRVLDFISGVMMPSISILCACGMIKGVNTILVVLGLITPTSGIYTLLNAIGDTIFFYFPIFLAYNSAKKVGMNQFLGMALGAALCYPAINGQPIDLFGFVVNATYTGSILPPILLVLFAAPIDKWLRKVIPDVVKNFLVPMLVLMICVPIGFAIIGPVANKAGELLTVLLQSAYDFSPILAGAIMGAAWQIFVMFGVHMVVMIGSMMNLMAQIPDSVLPLMAAVSFAQTGVVFAIWLKTKNKELKSIALPAWISGIFGVTEPAIYGITLPRVKYFVISCVGGAIGSMVIAALGVQAYTMSGMGVFMIPGMMNPADPMPGLINTSIACAVATIFSFVVTFVMYKDEGNDVVENNVVENEKKANKEVIYSPVKGKAAALSTCSDEAFAQGLLGKGLVIEPLEGKVVAPFDGTVMTLFPTKHAIGIVSEGGCELLIHIGMDTVKLEGKHFEAHIQQGDKVKKGDVLVTFDIEAIQKEGYPTVTPIIVTNTNDYLDVIEMTNGTVEAGEEILNCLN